MIVTEGSTNVSVPFYFVDDVGGTNPGEPTTGLLFSNIETGGSASYQRQGAARVDFTLKTLASASAAHDDGGFILVDDTEMPGVYRCDIPDAAVAAGVDFVIIYLRAATASNTITRPLKIDLTTVDLRETNGRVDVGLWLGSACVPVSVAGVPEVDLTHVAGATTNVSALATNVDAINTLAAGATGFTAIDTVVDGIQTDLSNATDGLGALKAIMDTSGVTLANGVHTIQQLVITGGSGHGIDITPAITSAGIYVRGGATSGEGISVNASGSSHAIYLGAQTGDGMFISSTSGDGIDILAGANGINVVGSSSDITADIVGTLSGAVGSVTGAVGSVTGDTKQTADVATLITTVGTAGDGLTAVPWNAAWDAEVESEVNDAIDTAISELGVAAPTATPTIRTGLMLLYMMARNQLIVQTSGTDAIEVYNNAGVKICAKVITDDGSDYTEAEMA